MTHKLEVDSIRLEFGLRPVITDVYLKCTTGNITGLLGRNGAGKSCLMNIIYGSLKASNQSVRFNDIPVAETYKKKGLITYLPQFNFLPKFLSLQRIFTDFSISYPLFEEYFPEFSNKGNERIKDLPLGNRRLVEVYIIIQTESLFSILDEPFTHLMPLHVEKIIGILSGCKLKKGLLITDHLYDQIITVCDQMYLLDDGKTHFIKSLSEIKSHGYLS